MKTILEPLGQGGREEVQRGFICIGNTDLGGFMGMLHLLLQLGTSKKFYNDNLSHL